MSWIAERFASFDPALRGIARLVADAGNARIHALATVTVVAFAWALDVPADHWALLILAMSLVWAAEAVNTAVEALADRISTDHDERIGRAKDVAAGAVLLAALGAAVVGFIVLGPPLWEVVAG